jgi:starvation-inducible DNA-binding protein
MSVLSSSAWLSGVNAAQPRPVPAGKCTKKVDRAAENPSIKGVAIQPITKGRRMTETKPSKHAKEMLGSPTDLGDNATKDISAALRGLLADVFVLYVKTKNFHWHLSGPHFRDYHLMLDEQSAQIFAMTDDIAERARKIGGTTIRSIGQIARQQRILDNDAEYVDAQDMLAELRDDNKQLTSIMRAVHDVCDEHNDVATASLLENWIDETERRTWFLYESTRG